MEYVLDVMTPLGFRVQCTAERWDLIARIKHPPMQGRLEDVRRTLAHPDEVRRSVRDTAVVLFHLEVGPRWVCAVVKRAEDYGFLVTAYPADTIKPGELLWKK
jgi:hypothetical protein